MLSARTQPRTHAQARALLLTRWWLASKLLLKNTESCKVSRTVARKRVYTCVRVWSSPKGLPMAKTFCPTSRFAEVPSSTGFSSDNFSGGHFSFSTAMSLSGSPPITCRYSVLTSHALENCSSGTAVPRLCTVRLCHQKICKTCRSFETFG